MYCDQCGEERHSKARYCFACGAFFAPPATRAVARAVASETVLYSPEKHGHLLAARAVQHPPGDDKRYRLAVEIAWLTVGTLTCMVGVVIWYLLMGGKPWPTFAGWVVAGMVWIVLVRLSQARGLPLGIALLSALTLTAATVGLAAVGTRIIEARSVPTVRPGTYVPAVAVVAPTATPSPPTPTPAPIRQGVDPATIPQVSTDQLRATILVQIDQYDQEVHSRYAPSSSDGDWRPFNLKMESWLPQHSAFAQYYQWLYAKYGCCPRWIIYGKPNGMRNRQTLDAYLTEVP